MTNQRILPEGIYVQPYRDAIPGRDKLAKIAREMDVWKQHGIKGVCWHGFVGDLSPERISPLTNLCNERSMLSLAAFGLNSLEPEQKGRWIGNVANSPGCDGVVFDMEGAWEDERSDKEKAIKMGEEFRKVAPNALAVDQPWPIPTYHWSLFPWEETSRFIDVRADQRYVNNWRRQWGRDAYERFEAWHKTEWAKLEARLARTDPSLVKPHIPTFQGYYWLAEDAVKAVLKYPTMIIWAEPFPEKEIMFAIRVKNKLAELGFRGEDAVRQFQLSVGGNKLTPDGLMGPKTARELGVDTPANLVW